MCKPFSANFLFGKLQIYFDTNMEHTKVLGMKILQHICWLYSIPYMNI